MAASVIVDAGFLVALLKARDAHHAWAVAEAERHERPWLTCESALSEALFLLNRTGRNGLLKLLMTGSIEVQYQFSAEQNAVLMLVRKYADVPMSLADACLVRMSEVLPDPLVLTTDTDFRIYRRNARQAVPCVLPR